MKRFVLNTLRESPEPLTSRAVTELWVQDRGLNADEQTLSTIRKRIGACIKTCKEQGLVKECGTAPALESGYGPYKLWRVVE